jgi:hypothetical protein
MLEKKSTTYSHALAAKAFDTKNLAAVKEVGDYIMDLFSQFSENVGQDPGVAKMADSWLVAIVIHRCRKSPNSRLEWQTMVLFVAIQIALLPKVDLPIVEETVLGPQF